MRSRLARLGVVAFSLLALLGTTTPAKADTVLSAAFQANVTIEDGIGYPVTTLPTPGPNILPDDPTTPDTNETIEHIFLPNGTLLETLAHLKGAEHVCDLPLKDGTFDDPECLTNSHWVYDHPRVISASSTECVDGAVNIDKLTKAPANAGICIFGSIDRPGLPNIITGHCGQSSGQIQVLFREGVVTGAAQDYILDLHFKTASTIVLITGHWFKVGSSQHGLIVAVATARPTETTTPTTDGPSCANKTQENFTVTGVAAAVSDPTL